MPDLGPALAALVDLLRPLLGPLVRVCFRALFTTAIGIGCVALGLLAAAYRLGSRSGSVTLGVVALVVALAAVAIIGPMLAVKRAIGRALLHALSELALGRKVLGVLFDDILRLEDEGEAGGRGGVVQRGVERLPLVDAERRCKQAVTRLTGEGDGFFATRIRAALLDRVAQLTLEAFRAEGAQGGGVDVVRVRQKLEETVDAALVARVRGALVTTTGLLLIALCTISLGAAWLIGR